MCVCRDNMGVWSQENKPRISFKGRAKDPFDVKWRAVIVHLKSAENLPDMDRFSKTDAYIKCKIEGRKMEGPGDSVSKIQVSNSIEGIDNCTFPAKTNNSNPKWDKKQVMNYDGAIASADLVIKVEVWDKDGMFNKDDSIGELTLRVPEPADGWKNHDNLGMKGGGKLHLALKTVDCPYIDVPTEKDLVGWNERILIGRMGAKASLLYSTKKGNTKMLLMVPGRNDTFMHFHVAKPFQERGFDIFALDYRGVGRAKRLAEGFDDYYSSHSEGHDEYIEDFDGALQFIDSTGTKYSTKMWYCHSTGAPITLNYLMKNKESGMTQLIMNSPYIGNTQETAGCGLTEFVVEDFTKCLSYGLDRTAIVSGGEAVCPYFFKQVWALYRYHPNLRPLYYTPHVTSGFLASVAMTQDTLMNQKHPPISCPTLLVGSRGDEVLCCEDNHEVADKVTVKSKLTKITLKDNAHDVFLSAEKEDNELAIQKLMEWVDKQFPERAVGA